MKKIFLVLILFLVWGSIFIIAKAVEKSGSVSSSGLVLEGFPEMRGEVINFTTKERINEYKSVTFLTTFNDTGSTDLRPIGDIKIKNWFGNEIDSIEFNQYGELLKAGGTKVFEDTYFKDSILSLLGFGKYTATLNLSYGPGNPITRQIYFWIIPWKILVTVMLAIIFYLVLVFSHQGKVKENFYGRVVLKPTR